MSDSKVGVAAGADLLTDRRSTLYGFIGSMIISFRTGAEISIFSGTESSSYSSSSSSSDSLDMSIAIIASF